MSLRATSLPILLAAFSLPAFCQNGQAITGQAAFADWNQEQPGVRRKITLADLPEPKPEESVSNQPHLVPRPADAWPVGPAGFKVTLYAGVMALRCSGLMPSKR